MKAGWYWYLQKGSIKWTIVLVRDLRPHPEVLFIGTDIDQSLEEAKGNGEFGTRIPQKKKRMGLISEITNQRKSANFK